MAAIGLAPPPPSRTTPAVEPGASSGGGFDPKLLQPEKQSFFAKWLGEHLLLIMGLLRRYWPIAKVPGTGLTFVTQYDDVREVLGRDDVFAVPFADKVKDLNGGPNFLLGMSRGPDYWKIQKQVMEAFRRDDVATVVTPMAARLSDEIVAKANGRLDAIQDLITAVPTRICEDYYGVRVDPAKHLDFAYWTFAMSLYMFGDPFDDPRVKQAAQAGAANVREVVDGEIARAGKAIAGGDTVLDRMVAGSKLRDGLTATDMRTFLIGMITGFIPTNTMAAGNMLEIMLQRPEFLARAQAAAQAGDDELLWRCLREASRFMPINPGPFRTCLEDTMVGVGTDHPTAVKKGDKLLVSTHSAMFDETRVTDPKTFNPDRPPTDYMIFGYGVHWCLGALIAETQMTQTMKALLAKKNLRRAGGPDGATVRLGSFPQNLVVEFDR